MSYTIAGTKDEWEVVIGLEVHAQVVSKAKLFSGAATDFGGEPNTQVSLVDAAMPGMLPVINERCVEQAVRTGLGLNAKINTTSVFDRKNYFYPDLPPGYQISQYQQPVVGRGEIHVDLPDGGTRTVGITRLHLEQDAGKSLHDQDPTLTYVDLNRAGVALMEIVSEPDLRGPDEAAAYIAKMRSILRYLGTCDGNMEQGSMRADVNVSVRPVGSVDYGTRCEIKNVNSVRFIRQAIEYEARRQVDLLEEGGSVDQETRLFDSGRGITRSMRTKEEAHDYRYFPDPDLLPLELDPDWIEDIRRTLPELPDAKKERFIKGYGLIPDQAAILVADKAIAEAFEQTVKSDLGLQFGGEKASRLFAHAQDPSTSLAEADAQELEQTATANTNIIVGSVFAKAKEIGEDVASLLNRLNLPDLNELVRNDVISGRIAKDVFEEMVATGKDASVIVSEKGLQQISDSGAIEAEIERIVGESAKQVEQYLGGNEKILGWFVGQVMKATQGKANPALVNEILRKKLNK